MNTPVIATLANMRAHYCDGIFAYSPDTGERCSADPGDYFMMAEDDSLNDEIEQPMVLAYERTEIVIVRVAQ